MRLTDSTVLTEHVFTREISDHRADQTLQRDVHSVMQMENRLGVRFSITFFPPDHLSRR